MVWRGRIFLPVLLLHSTNEYVSQMISERNIRTKRVDLVFLLLCHQLPTAQTHKTFNWRIKTAWKG